MLLLAKTHQHCFHYYLQIGSFFHKSKTYIFFSKQQNKNVHYSPFDIRLLTDILKLFIFTYFGLCASEKSITQKYTQVQLQSVFMSLVYIWLGLHNVVVQTKFSPQRDSKYFNIYTKQFYQLGVK